MEKVKMTKDTVPEDFTMTLALVDSLPVLFFGAGMIVVSILFSSKLFFLGALLCLFAGAAKVIWKIIVVLKHKNVWWLFLQMRILMPIGFAAMIIGVIINKDAVNFAAILSAIVSLPAVVFFAVGIFGMVLMLFFEFKLDSSNVKANWIEQLTNGIAQASFFVGLLLITL